MTLVGHLEELRSRVLRSLLAVVVGAAARLLFVRPLVRLLEVPAKGIHFLQPLRANSCWCPSRWRATPDSRSPFPMCFTKASPCCLA